MTTSTRGGYGRWVTTSSRCRLALSLCPAGRYFRPVNEFGTDRRKDGALARATVSKQQALKHLSAGRYDTAIRRFTTAIRLDFDNAGYHVGRALAYASREDFPMALGDFTRTISIDRGNAVACRGRGLAYARIGDYEQAIIDLDEAIRLDPLNIAPP